MDPQGLFIPMSWSSYKTFYCCAYISVENIRNISPWTKSGEVKTLIFWGYEVSCPSPSGWCCALPISRGLWEEQSHSRWVGSGFFGGRLVCSEEITSIHGKSGARTSSWDREGCESPILSKPVMVFINLGCFCDSVCGEPARRATIPSRSWADIQGTARVPMDTAGVKPGPCAQEK